MVRIKNIHPGKAAIFLSGDRRLEWFEEDEVDEKEAAMLEEKEIAVRTTSKPKRRAKPAVASIYDD